MKLKNKKYQTLFPTWAQKVLFDNFILLSGYLYNNYIQNKISIRFFLKIIS